MDDLLALSEGEIKKINEKINEENNFPERDDIVLPKDLYGAYKQGLSKDVDMLIGTNAHELRYWIHEVGNLFLYRIVARVLSESHKKSMTPEEQTIVDSLIEEETKKHNSKTWGIAELYNEIYFRLPAIEMAKSHAKNGGNTYVYLWEKESAIPNLRACHAVELSYVLNNLDDTIYTGEPADPKLASIVQDMWVNFAITGNPSTKDYTWEEYDETSGNTIVLGDEVYLKQAEETKRDRLLKPLLKYYFSSNMYFISFDIPFVYKVLTGLGISVIAIGAIIKQLRK